MEEKTIEKKWELKRAVKNTFTWDKTDWEYIKKHIIWILLILLLSYLYFTETRMCHIALRDLPETCEIYQSIKLSMLENTSIENINLSKARDLTFENLTHG